MQAANLTIKNAKIITLYDRQPSAWGVAIQDGCILALLNDNNDVERFIGPHTQVIDAQGRTVIPGLNDSHFHIIREGLNYNLEVRWDNSTSLKDALILLKNRY